jgi:hypothetical protein
MALGTTRPICLDLGTTPALKHGRYPETDLCLKPVPVRRVAQR